jgi:hypothetical protein
MTLIPFFWPEWTTTHHAGWMVHGHRKNLSVVFLSYIQPWWLVMYYWSTSIYLPSSHQLPYLFSYVHSKQSTWWVLGIPFSNSQGGRLHLLRNVAIGKTKRIPKPILNNHHLMLSRNQSSSSDHKDTIQPWNQEVVSVTWQTVLPFSRWNPPTARKKGMADQYPRKKS